MVALQRSGISGMVRLSESAGRSIAATQRWEMERMFPCTKGIISMLESIRTAIETMNYYVNQSY